MKLTREKKRAIIISAYSVLFILFCIFAYLIFKPAETCFDGKRNQNETGIDCGGVCPQSCEKTPVAENLEIKEVAFVYGGQDKFDVMMKVKNPNDHFGAESFEYKFALKDQDGKVVSERQGSSFILPTDDKYVIEMGLESKEIPVSVSAEIISYEWKEFMGYNEEPELNIYQKRYELISGGVGYSRLYGLVRNESHYDFNLIKVNVVMRDNERKPIALNRTEMRTVHSGEQRDFSLIWPTSFPGDVENVEAEAEADVFNNQNFIKTYYPQSKKFQEFEQ